MLHDKPVRVQFFFALQLGLLVDVGEALVLFLDAAELGAASLGSFSEGGLGVRECDHQVIQVLLRKTMTVSALLDARFVSLAGLEAHQYLVVAEVASRVEREVLVPVFVRQTERHLALEDQVELTEVFQALDDRLVGDENTAVEHRNEEGQELSASFADRALIVLISEHVIEVANHWLEQLLDQLVPQARLELHQELVTVDELLVVVRQRLLNVHLDFIVKDLRE